ncbi:MAG: hypothetical protein EOO24_20525 [Comamonadaceae bacterium]|nr:MAG: hypothetical protein EOO24_20525 [Comamonadaceae bacterium]
MASSTGVLGDRVQLTRSVETPSVVYFNGQYHMFYTGYTGHWSESLNYRIGHAVSPDGIRWTKDPSFLIGPTAPADPNPTMDFRQSVCAEPGAVVFNNKLYLYFTAIGANAQVNTVIQTIGLTVLDPATGTWSTPQMALMPDQSAYPRSSCYGFSTPAACVRNGKVHLFYSIVQAEPWAQVAIGNAVSANGTSGWALNTLPVINRDVAWRSKEVLAPSVVVDTAGTHLWFGGNNGVNLGVGYVKLA